MIILMCRYLRTNIWSLMSLLCICGLADAADSCWPTRVLEEGRLLKFLVTEQNLAPRIDAKLANDLVFKSAPERFGLSAGVKSTVLLQPVPVSGHVLGRGAIVDDMAQLTFDMDSGAAWLYTADRRYVLQVVDGKSRDAAGQPLAVRPVLIRPLLFEVGPGAAVRATDNGQVIVAKGATLIWRATMTEPLEVILAKPARLRETAQETSTSTASIAPIRMTPGGKARLQIESEGLDLRSSHPIFCFAALAGAGSSAVRPRVVPAENIKLINQSGGKAVFEVQMPKPGTPEQSLSEGSNWWQRVAGLPVELRVLTVSGQTMLLDLPVRLTLASHAWSVGAGVAVLIVLYILSATLKRRWNPVALAGELILSNGRYSVSNLQILMWTVLVIFSLFVALMSSGQLLALSDGVLALLGISAGSSILARVVEAKIGPQPPATTGEVIPKISDLVFNQDDAFDLLRFQMLGFTLFTWLYSLISVLRSEGLPDIPNDLLMLMGVSNAVYVGGKMPGLVGTGSASGPISSDMDQVLPTPFEKGLTRERIEVVQQQLGVNRSGTLDRVTREAIANCKRVYGIYPANGRINEFLLVKLASVSDSNSSKTTGA